MVSHERQTDVLLGSYGFSTGMWRFLYPNRTPKQLLHGCWFPFRMATIGFDPSLFGFFFGDAFISGFVGMVKSPDLHHRLSIYPSYLVAEFPHIPSTFDPWWDEFDMLWTGKKSTKNSSNDRMPSFTMDSDLMRSSSQKPQMQQSVVESTSTLILCQTLLVGSRPK